MARHTKQPDMPKPDQTVPKPNQNSTGVLLSIGRMSLLLGIDRKTLRKWARIGAVPSFVNPVNGYLMFLKNDVMAEYRRLQSGGQSQIDLRKRKS